MLRTRGAASDNSLEQFMTEESAVEASSSWEEAYSVMRNTMLLRTSFIYTSSWVSRAFSKREALVLLARAGVPAVAAYGWSSADPETGVRGEDPLVGRESAGEAGRVTSRAMTHGGQRCIRSKRWRKRTGAAASSLPGNGGVLGHLASATAWLDLSQ